MKRKFIVVHSVNESHNKIIVFCDSIDAYTENKIKLTHGTEIYYMETGREICELLHSKGVI